MFESQATPASQIATRDVGHDLQRFEAVLLDWLDNANLPTTDVLVDVEERSRLISNLDGALARLGNDERYRALYISKMITAAAVGLFDAALNYLWDETISELRRRIASYDLAYFFEIAVPSTAQRSKLSTAEDLAKVDDQSLLTAAEKIGLLSN